MLFLGAVLIQCVSNRAMKRRCNYKWRKCCVTRRFSTRKSLRRSRSATSKRRRWQKCTRCTEISVDRFVTKEAKWTANSALLQLLDLDDEERSLRTRKDYLEEHLRTLQRTNVLNLAFHIWHKGQFGVINDQRLGRLPDQLVEWMEINAALGHAVALLNVSTFALSLDVLRRLLRAAVSGALHAADVQALRACGNGRSIVHTRVARRGERFW